MSIINVFLFVVSHKFMKIGILFQIIHINYYLLFSNQYTAVLYAYIGTLLYTEIKKWEMSK